MCMDVCYLLSMQMYRCLLPIIVYRMFGAKMPSDMHVATLWAAIVDLIILLAVFKLSFICRNYGLENMVSTCINCLFSLLYQETHRDCPLGTRDTMQLSMCCWDLLQLFVKPQLGVRTNAVAVFF